MSAESPLSVFGPWAQNLDALHKSFTTADPYEHVVLEPFLSEETANALLGQFPELSDQRWFRYYNPIENKFAMNKFDGLDVVQKVFAALQSPEFIELVTKITGIPNLENDPHLHGAGLHCHPREGKLDMHLDYSIHPVSGKERRLNLILYLNKEWQQEWGGDIQLWDAEFTGPKAQVTPSFNRAVLFRTSDLSWHGMPRPFTCPEGSHRKSLAIYYVSDPRPDVTHRYKAQFRPLPDQVANEKLLALYEIRRQRVIKAEELEAIYPDWKTDPIGKGHWFI